MKKRIRNLAIVIMVFAVTFTSLPMMTGDLSVHAASAKKPAKVTGVKKKAAGANYITVKWNRIKKNKNTKGYTIYVNGRSVKSVGKNTLYYKIDGLSQNTDYTFQVKAYNTYKQKQYYNSKTMKWQAKKPKKKSWKGKKTRKVTKYKYGASSAKVTIKTARAAAPANLSSASTTSGGSASAGETRIITDFRGVTNTVVIKSDGQYYWDASDTTPIPESTLIRCDRTRNGIFTYSGAQYKQQSGATFRLTGGGTNYIEGSMGSLKDKGGGTFAFSAYNVDTSKLQIRLVGSDLEKVKTYSWDQDNNTYEAYTTTYVRQNNKRIAKACDGNGDLYKFANKEISVFIRTTSGGTDGIGLGIFNGTITLQLTYDNVNIGNMQINSCNETLADNGMSPKRRMYYAVAETAINGNPSGTILGDYRIIRDWIRTNIKNGQSYSTAYGTINSFTCLTGAAVLETWLIYNYGDAAYGFYRGSANQAASHRDFCLNSDPDSPLHTI